MAGGGGEKKEQRVRIGPIGTWGCVERGCVERVCIHVSGSMIRSLKLQVIASMSAHCVFRVKVDMTMCTVAVSKQSCKHANHLILTCTLSEAYYKKKYRQIHGDARYMKQNIQGKTHE
jgi:hypothetical protein